jgi:hypothetical protein
MTFSIVTSFLAHPCCSNSSLAASSRWTFTALPPLGFFLPPRREVSARQRPSACQKG